MGWIAVVVRDWERAVRWERVDDQVRRRGELGGREEVEGSVGVMRIAQVVGKSSNHLI